MLGTWAVSGDPQLSVPVIDGIRNVAGNAKVTWSKGANITDDTTLAKHANVFGLRVDIDKRMPDSMIHETMSQVAQADVIVAVVGEASEMSGEASSRSDISMPPSQKKLITALAKTGKPLVLVIMSGRPLIMNDELRQATAILQAWHPGSEAGNAIADVLFGNYNPSGKLTMSYPRNVGQIPVYYNHKNTGRPLPGEPFQKFRSAYLDVENTPLLPFGYGLSYTKFEYSDIRLSQPAITMNQKLNITVTLKNSGNYDGHEVVQLYIRDLVASITRPVKELKGFQKIFLKKGESRDVTFTIGKNELSFYDGDGKVITEPGEFKVFIGTNSRDVKEATFNLKR